MEINRRKFMIGCGLLVACPNLVHSESVEQRIVVNIPSYKLTLFSGAEKYEFPVAVGKLDNKRRATPIGSGVVSEKRKRIVFRFDKDYPGIKKGDLIVWNNTFDSQGKPVRHKIPYDKMRGLALEITKMCPFNYIQALSAT